MRHYEGLVRGVFVEAGDEGLVGVPECAVRGGKTVMTDRAARDPVLAAQLDAVAGRVLR